MNNIGAAVRIVAELLAAIAVFILIFIIVDTKGEVATLDVKLAKAQVELEAASKKISDTENSLALAERRLDKAAKGTLWEYEGRFGPDFWNKAFPVCGNGKQQSPIDIRGPFGRSKTKIRIDYKVSSLKILNNGHSVQVNVPPGSRLFVDEVPFDLLQFHFHKPGEELIDGKPSEMNIHFVHKSADGRLAVLGVLLQSFAADNRHLRPIWAHMPIEEGPIQDIPETNIDPAKLLPDSLSFYQYEGSLTTPPCTEGVTFFILKTKVPISVSQLKAFPIHGPNNRPIQPLNGRTIYVSD
jgi:carbonic anhydrase